MSRVWWQPPPHPDPSPQPDGPRVTVPRPTHARLRDSLIEVLGLDDDCSDGAIVAAVLLRTT